MKPHVTTVKRNLVTYFLPRRDVSSSNWIQVLANGAFIYWSFQARPEFLTIGCGYWSSTTKARGENSQLAQHRFIMDRHVERVWVTCLLLLSDAQPSPRPTDPSPATVGRLLGLSTFLVQKSPKYNRMV